MEYSKESIDKAICTKWAGRTVHFAQETDSTNNWLIRLSGEGAPHGAVAVTEFQNAGKGRMGRSWTAEAGSSVMFSLLLRPKIAPQYASMLTLVMGMAVARAVESLGFAPQIKWPNDVVLSRRKICGILTEMGLSSGEIRHVVIGTGINVNLKEIAPELADKATSLYLEGGREYDRTQVLVRVLESFEIYYEQFVQDGSLKGLREEYERFLANKNQPVRVLDLQAPYEGICAGINDGGELLVQRENGETTAVRAGEVSVRGLYSYV